MIKPAKISLSLIISFLLFTVIFTKSSYASTVLKPNLTWQRSTEAQDKIIQETELGSKISDALNLPLDSNQIVFDSGISTPIKNKSAVGANISWASWVQYSASNPNSCGPVLELRHFQAKFTLSNLANIQNIKLVSPYYSGDVFPINDNVYIYLNGNFIKRLGTVYGAVNRGFGGTATIANETDGWVADDNLGIAPIQYLRMGENTIDIIVGETCVWGGMGKVELVLELSAPAPFLDLPWDYEGKGKSFSDAVLAINSYFDHEYPLLSSGIGEPIGKRNSVKYFGGGESSFDLDYSSHDGYDYGVSGGADLRLGDPVLAAGSGCASYVKYSDGNNVIKIDHGNGYQTRYLHLKDDNFLITKSSACTEVSRGRRIGSIGFSGTVRPEGPRGAHLHFMVIQDKNNDGNFEDNIPDGATDPLGWQSEEADPWPAFTFNQGGQARGGNKSWYLFTRAIDNLRRDLDANGGFFELGRHQLTFPQGAVNQTLQLEMRAAPTARPSDILRSIGTAITVTARDLAGNLVKTFHDFFTITIDFSGFDLSGFNTDTIAIYSSEDGINWTREETIVNLVEKTASARVNHLSRFVLMAERIDAIAPITTAVLTGSQGEPNFFRSDAVLTLSANDNEGGPGIDYTLYKINDEDWRQYTDTLTFSQEGNYTIQFYSVDYDENIEDIKSISFTIDKTPPEAKFSFNTATLQTEVIGMDNNSDTQLSTENTDSRRKTTITDKAGNTTTINYTKTQSSSNNTNSITLSVKSITYNNNPQIQYQSNGFSTSWSMDYPDITRIKSLGQNFIHTNNVYLTSGWQLSTNQTTITINYLDQSQPQHKEIKDGLVLLSIATNNGKLEYRW